MWYHNLHFIHSEQRNMNTLLIFITLGLVTLVAGVPVPVVPVQQKADRAVMQVAPGAVQKAPVPAKENMIPEVGPLQKMQNELRQLKRENSKLHAQLGWTLGSNRNTREYVSSACSPHAATSAANSDDTYNSLFAVGLPGYSNAVGDGEIIVWTEVQMDIGNNYNSVTGQYVAPYDGTYRFAVQKTGENTNYAPFWILVNSQRYFFSAQFSADNEPVNCVTVDIELTAGSLVAVQNEGDSTIYGQDSSYTQLLSWFTGYLLPTA